MPSESYQSPYAGSYPDVVEPTPDYGEPAPSETTPYTVFPYRGIQTHGVDPSAVPETRDEDIAGGKVVSSYNAEPSDDPAPVPVRIVETAAREFSRWRAYQTLATANPSIIVNRQEGRSALTIKNLDAGEDVYIGPDSGVSVLSGFRIDSGGEYSLSGEAEVWAVRGGAADVAVAIAFEYSTPT
jgi:hypothetical protein